MDTSRLSISRAEVASRLAHQAPPLVIDVRRPERFAASEIMLSTARFCTPEDLARLAMNGTPQEVIVYCVYGHGLSQGAAKLLRDAGWNARYLEGGIEGGEEGVDQPQDIVQWRAQLLPVIQKRSSSADGGGA